MRTIKEIHNEMLSIAKNASQVAKELEMMMGGASHEVSEQPKTKRMYRRRTSVMHRGARVSESQKMEVLNALQELGINKRGNQEKLSRRLGFRYSTTLARIKRSGTMSGESARRILNYYNTHKKSEVESAPRSSFWGDKKEIN